MEVGHWQMEPKYLPRIAPGGSPVRAWRVLLVVTMWADDDKRAIASESFCGNQISLARN
ncbi:hypothetical protein SAMD00023353_1500750 [Rosellinia necatrix]|uniref:Uncharacterized protein n=1 Tax=Rosellinia necatrix TaxID=77044 RepID=A0A1S8A712_ROSNE|nr:hypothetical protein SAMD00023353_1500750 [Rosellinia necatrix]